jgi:hypothetical protein
MGENDESKSVEKKKTDNKETIIEKRVWHNIMEEAQ